MFGDKPATTLFEICVEKTTEKFGDINKEAANKINWDWYVDDLVTGGTADQVARFMGKLCNATGT